MCSCSEDKQWSVWNILDAQNYTNKGIIPNNHMRSIYSISWSGETQNGNSELIATGAADNRICVFEVSKKDLDNDQNQSFAFNTLV